MRPAPTGLRLEMRRRASVERPAEAPVDGLSKTSLVIPPEMPWLVSSDEGGSSYDPFREEPSLFRRFAELPPTDKEGMLAFAKEFGLLGVSELSVVERSVVDQLVLAEPFDAWVREVRAMKHAVDLFDAIQARDQKRLAQWITVTERAVKYRREDALGFTHFTFTLPSRERGGSQPPKITLFAVARGILQSRYVNDRLREYTSLLVVDAGRERQPRLRAVPANLLGALWLELARAYDGNIHYRRCEWSPCQKWIEITRTFDGHTKAARFCCDAHRVYDHKKRNPKPKRGRKA